MAVVIGSRLIRMAIVIARGLGVLIKPCEAINTTELLIAVDTILT
jgi:hypothetical protein